jgi:hypothetical protein
LYSDSQENLKKMRARGEWLSRKMQTEFRQKNDDMSEFGELDVTILKSDDPRINDTDRSTHVTLILSEDDDVMVAPTEDGHFWYECPASKTKFAEDDDVHLLVDDTTDVAYVVDLGFKRCETWCMEEASEVWSS